MGKEREGRGKGRNGVLSIQSFIHWTTQSERYLCPLQKLLYSSGTQEKNAGMQAIPCRTDREGLENKGRGKKEKEEEKEKKKVANHHHYHPLPITITIQSAIYARYRLLLTQTRQERRDAG